MHPLLRFPYAALGAAAEVAVALAPQDRPELSKWRRALSARRGLDARLDAFAPKRDASRKLAWFHAPSVGEALMALPVMHGVHASAPNAQIAFTWYSPSAEAFAPRFDADFRDYLAFDTGRAARAALGALKPTALVYSKLDVWPVLTGEAAANGVRLGLVAATLSVGSSRRGRLARALLGDSYRQLDRVGAASSDDAERLVELGVRASAVTVTGDTRYDQVSERVRRMDRSRAPISTLASDRPTLVAGSTWPSDEAPLQAAWERVRAEIPSARLIIAPHEPTAHHLGPLRAWGARAGLTTAFLSEPAAQTADLVLVDSVGLLAEVYGVATMAFVGGGFHGFGLHSVLEPAALEVPVAFGPNWRSSRDAAGLIRVGGARATKGWADLAAIIRLWMADSSARGQAGSAAGALVRSGLGASVRTVEIVLGLLG